MPMKDSRGSFKLLVGTSNIFLCFGHVNLSNRKKFFNPPVAGKKVLCLIIGFPSPFCQFYAHEGLHEVFQVACGHCQYFSVLWTCEFANPKKVLQQSLGRLKGSLLHDLVSQNVRAILCLQWNLEVFKDACGNFQWLSVLWTCELKQQKKVLQLSLGRQKSSLPHDWVYYNVLHILCP